MLPACWLVGQLPVLGCLIVQKKTFADNHINWQLIKGNKFQIFNTYSYINEKAFTHTHTLKHNNVIEMKNDNYHHDDHHND